MPRQASDDLADHIGNWLSDQIALGARPIDLFDSFARALGIGLRMFTEVSVPRQKDYPKAFAEFALAILIYARSAKVDIHTLQEH